MSIDVIVMSDDEQKGYREMSRDEVVKRIKAAEQKMVIGFSRSTKYSV